MSAYKIRKNGGGWQAVWYVLKSARNVGPFKLWKALSSKNACKTCALGMGGQKGGMRNELGHWPEVCKKSVQAMVSDMQPGISETFFKKNCLHELRTWTPRQLEKSGRLAFPIIKKAGSDSFERLSWDEAYERISKKIAATAPNRGFFYVSGRSSNEAGFLLQLFARAYGTNHVNNCSFYCHQASGVGLKESLGTGTATIGLNDLVECDLFFLIGANPASNHPRLLTMLKELRKRGGDVIVVNPLLEPGLINFKIPSDPMSMAFGSRIASEYISVRVGGDIALLSGIAKVVLESGHADNTFVDEHTEGFADFANSLRQLTWTEIESGSGISETVIRKLAERYIKSNKTVFGWCMGITHHLHGVANVQMITNLALLRGMIGKTGAGLLPIRGHSNVQGIGSMKVNPELGAAMAEKLAGFGIEAPSFTGYDTMACMDAALKDEMDFAFCLGGNLYGSNPDAKRTLEAFNKIDSVVYLSTTLNTGHVWGTGKEVIVLPVLARDEESQLTTQESMFNFVRISSGGKPRLPGLKSESEIICELAHRICEPHSLLNWQSLKEHSNIRKLIATVIPEYDSLEQVDAAKKEFQIPNRIMTKPNFFTKSGKAKFALHPLPKNEVLAENEVIMMTIRSEGQFNTVVYEENDLYRGQERRNVVLMNPQDMKRLSLKPDQLITIKSSVGAMKGMRVRPYHVSEGSAAMYYPEANELVPKNIDPHSKTPAFKSVKVAIYPSSGQ